METNNEDLRKKIEDRFNEKLPEMIENLSSIMIDQFYKTMYEITSKSEENGITPYTLTILISNLTICISSQLMLSIPFLMPDVDFDAKLLLAVCSNRIREAFKKLINGRQFIDFNKNKDGE